jgi:uncharacterized membrane protein YadS
VDDEFSATLASAVSICGVSAAIATSGAIKGDPKKLSYTTSLVLVCAVPMMVLQPYIARWFSIPDAVAGAWLGAGAHEARRLGLARRGGLTRATH